jgi:hypothetical protein
MSTTIDHDALWKELVRVCLFDLLEIFAPRLAEIVQPGRAEFLNTELRTPSGTGQRADIVVRVWLRDGRPIEIIIHIEIQATDDPDMPWRMHCYHISLHTAPDVLVYPIALFLHDRPLRPVAAKYGYKLADLQVLQFKYKVVQLSRLNWRRFLTRREPVLIALMAKMRMKPNERVKVRLECLRRLVGLESEDLKNLLWGIVETYLKLEPAEEAQFQAAVARLKEPEQEKLMEYPNSWRDKGREEGMTLGRQEGMALGRQEGLARGQIQSALRILRRRFGDLPADVAEKIQALPNEMLGDLLDASLDFRSLDEARQWLGERTTVSRA